MTTTVSGPMFEPAEWGPWKSSHGKEGAHFNIYHCKDEDGMLALRDFFPKGEANGLNFVLFSTSGIAGTYSTIEREESPTAEDLEWLDETHEPRITFVIVQPRIVCMRYGNCEPKTPEDFAFLKKLRASSWAAVQTIGAEERKP